MNVSAKILKQLKTEKSFLTAKNTTLVVVCDDLDTKPGKVKHRTGGSARGHNGIRSIQSLLGEDFDRVLVGIGRPNGGSKDPEDVGPWVLGQWTKDKEDKDWAQIEGFGLPETDRLVQEIVNKALNNQVIDASTQGKEKNE